MNQFVAKARNLFTMLVKAGSPTNDDERLICESWLLRRDEALAKTMLYYGLFFHSTSMFIHPYLVEARYKPTIISIHLMIFVAELWWVLFSKRQKKISVTQFVLAMEIIAVSAFAIIAHSAYNSLTTTVNEKIFATTGFITIAAVLTILIPAHNVIVFMTTLFYFAISAAVLFDGQSVPLFWVNLTGSLLTCALVLHWAHTTLTKMSAIREFRTRAGMAPLQIVRKSISEETSVESIFTPKLRYCVCISSDWRSFQEMTARIDSRSVAETLSSYYQMCNEELRFQFPSGNYYSDWIADELFIVVFTDNPLEMMELTRQSLDFSKNILAKKAEFVVERSFPLAIDIGMSVGQAMVGMMGPVQHRKATALGEIPGRSRRLQGTGKLLRHHLGDIDRIVFDEDFAQTLPDTASVQHFTISADGKLRDLTCRTLYFVELSDTLNEKRSA